jgi:hypothetical protein
MQLGNRETTNTTATNTQHCSHWTVYSPAPSASAPPAPSAPSAPSTSTVAELRGISRLAVGKVSKQVTMFANKIHRALVRVQGAAVSPIAPCANARPKCSG